MMYNYVVTIRNESRPASFHIVCITSMASNLNMLPKYSLLIPKGRFFLKMELLFCGSRMIPNLLPPTVQTAGCAPLYILTEAVCHYLSVSRKREFLLATLGAVGQMCTVPSPHNEVTSALMSLIVCSVHILRMLH